MTRATGEIAFHSRRGLVIYSHDLYNSCSFISLWRVKKFQLTFKEGALSTRTARVTGEPYLIIITQNILAQVKVGPSSTCTTCKNRATGHDLNCLLNSFNWSLDQSLPKLHLFNPTQPLGHHWRQLSLPRTSKKVKPSKRRRLKFLLFKHKKCQNLPSSRLMVNLSAKYAA